MCVYERECVYVCVRAGDPVGCARRPAGDAPSATLLLAVRRDDHAALQHVARLIVSVGPRELFSAAAPCGPPLHHL
jgi:hypothetical protein